jgi:hypothetical protein
MVHFWQGKIFLGAKQLKQLEVHKKLTSLYISKLWICTFLKLFIFLKVQNGVKGL